MLNFSKKYIFIFSLFALLTIPKLLLSDTYIPLRIAFPALCKSHFHNNKVTAKTWIESEDIHTIQQFGNYLKFIPRSYEADCCKCPTCGGITLVMNNELNFPTGEEGDDAFPYEEILKCHQNNIRSRMEYCENLSDNCEKTCWDGAYFRKWNHKYLNFFKHFLMYCAENTNCTCYWPELSRKAVIINNTVYKLLKELAANKLLDSSYSDDWVAQEIGFDYFKGRILKDNYFPNDHGMAGSLTTYTFFYSQYHKTLLSVASFIDFNEILGNSRALDKIYLTLENIGSEFLILYNRCLKSHPHPKIYYERGMLKMHFGKTEQALADIRSFMDLAITDEHKNSITLTSDMYQQEGQVYADLGKYDLAIASLTEAIKIDPKNKEAYFQRAAAYFETGNFDEALKDYLISEKGNEEKSNLKASEDFSLAFIKGTCKGAGEGAIDFIPSLCNTAYGLGTALWAIHPLNTESSENIKSFANACCEMGEWVVDYCKTVDINTELGTLYERYDQLNDAEKGELIGHTIGKYGVDFFTGGLALKGISAFRKLKAANQICNLEAMAISNANKEAIVASSLKHASEREHFLKNIKIEIDKQNKHVFGKHNYDPQKSIFEHSNAEDLLKKYSGSGKPVRGNFLEPGYQEVVNFEEFIGYGKNH